MEMGGAEDVYTHPLHPYTKSLISAIPLPDPESERHRHRLACSITERELSGALTEAESGHFVLSGALA